MATFAVIIPAAGKSTRFRANRRKKPFVDLKGRAIWLRSAELFVSREDVVKTLVVVSEDDLEWFKEKFRPNLAFMDIEIVPGGAERCESVQNALARVPADVDFVAIHDAARPLITKEWVDDIFRAAETANAVVPAVPVAGTLKRVGRDSKVEETVSREGLWEAQTPQVFRRELLLQAFAKRGDLHPTDEAQLVEHFGETVTVIKGSPMNFKITTSDDFKMASVVLGALPKPKTFDALHPFADEEPRGL